MENLKNEIKAKILKTINDDVDYDFDQFDGSSEKANKEAFVDWATEIKASDAELQKLDSRKASTWQLFQAWEKAREKDGACIPVYKAETDADIQARNARFEKMQSDAAARAKSAMGY